VLKLQPVGVSGLDVKAYNYLQHPDLCAAFQKIVEHRYWMTLFHGMETPSSLHCHQCNIQSELIDGYDRCRSKMSRRVGYDMHYPYQLTLAHFDSILHLTPELVDWKQRLILNNDVLHSRLLHFAIHSIDLYHPLPPL
jgi:hypothetical protein